MSNRGLPLSEVLDMALTSVKAHKLRSGLTMFGIAIGVFSVIGVMTAITAMKGSIESGLNVLGANSFQIMKYPAIQMGGHDRSRYANRRDIDLETSMRFKGLMEESGASISLMLRRGGRQAFYLDRRTNPSNLLAGTDENFLAARNFNVIRGRNLTADDVDFGRAVCVIGNDIVKVLFPNEDPINQAIRVEGQSFTVVGLLEEKGTSFGSSQDNYIVIPITRFLQVYGRMGRSISINVQAPNPEQVDPVMERSIGAMRLVRGLEPEDADDFEIFSNDSLISAFNSIADVVAIGAFVISAIALLAAGIGIMNIMLVSVSERVREIGIRMAIGAKPRHVLTQFLAEAVVMCVLGGVVGVVLAAMGVWGVNQAGAAGSFRMDLSASHVLVAVLFSTGVGLFFGWYPARRASRLLPIECLRQE